MGLKYLELLKNQINVRSSVDNFDLYCLLQGISSKEKVKLLNPEKSIIEKSEFQHKYNMFLNFTRLKNDCDCNEDTNVYFPIQKWFELLVEKRKIHNKLYMSF